MGFNTGSDNLSSLLSTSRHFLTETPSNGLTRFMTEISSNIKTINEKFPSQFSRPIFSSEVTGVPTLVLHGKPRSIHISWLNQDGLLAIS